VVFYRIKKIGKRYYLMKEWWDPDLHKKKSLCLGNCEQIEKLVLQYRRGSSDISSTELRRMVEVLELLLSKIVSISKSAKLSKTKLVLPSFEKFEIWLKQRISKNTLKNYRNYFYKLPNVIYLEDIPELVKNKWYGNLLRLLAEYLWEIGVITLEEKERVKALVRSCLKKTQNYVNEEIVDMDSFLQTMRFLRKRNYLYYIVYEIMYYSGARLEEATYLIENYKSFLKRIPPHMVKTIGYVDLGSAVRVNIHYNRGRKRCEHLWLPKQLFLSLRETAVSARNISYYARDHKLMQPKLVRKLHYQILEDLIVDVSLRNFIQNRFYKLTVGDLNYSKLVLRADKNYVSIILPELEQRFKEAVT